MNTWAYQRTSASATSEQQIYDHLLYWVRTESPDAMLKRFHTLFVGGLRYPEPEIRDVLDEYVSSLSAKQNFPHFFNRCCHILVNRWQSEPLTQGKVAELVQMIGRTGVMPSNLGRSRGTTRTRLLIQEFARTPYYERLYRLGEVLNPIGHTATPETQPLSSLLQRYPYLYKHCLASQEDAPEQLEMIRQTQAKAEEKFNQDLVQFLTQRLCFQGHAPSEDRPPVRNPTLLSDQDLLASIKHYVGDISLQGSYKDMAQHFLSQQHRFQTYEVFKQYFYQYLVDTIDPKFGKCRFNRQLKDFLNNLYPESHGQKMSEALLARTCTQVMNFLVIESCQKPKHIIFIDLLNNIGSTATIGLLLKVVLICKKARPYLERRFALLFNHYQAQSCAAAQWLVHCLEKVNLALTANFSRFNFSFIKVF
ncbi:hypothetical protein GS597_12495 [Synechococcales cyanobacterium C]|uniref:Uncharacterized protein n=1 Tax=Petrachloros mirabilis ULC683 TaxID=2781853 RepID=A0A8K2A7V6_9CYAN|nr:hypothetical protein [Petrachloros mirabilis]NCJ07311.1 hypothetical protein [Petrachloros mirabilis ULC683]